MAILLFRLRGVPDDEADEVRGLLSEHRIDFYETPPSRWGISMEAIWLRDDEQLAQARKLLDEYQQSRTLRVKTEYDRLKQEGKAPGMISRIKNNPLQFIFITIFILFILYVSTMPFIDLGK